MRIVLLGPPGAGKGSLALLYRTKLGLAHLSTGQIFREEMARGSALGRRVKRYVTTGQLVPDALVVRVMASQLQGSSVAQGYVLDGFPRTRRQAEGLDRVLETRGQAIDIAIYLIAPVSLLVRRLSGRRVCAACGTNYHVRTMRPKRAGTCDRCNGALIIRKDDQAATIRTRLKVDRKVAAPLVQYYRKRKILYTIDARGGVETVFERTVKLFTHNGWLP